VSNALELLERELSRKRVLPPCVHMCLSTDPFMVGYPEVSSMSLALVERLNRAKIACSLLTKGVLPQELADHARFTCDNILGISLVSMNEGFRRQWEPGAASYAERIAALSRLHDAGCRTLVHIEPYPTPNIMTQDLSAMLEAVAFVDHIFFGCWSYNARATEFPRAREYYRTQSNMVRRFCVQHGIEYEGGQA
jgi:DNA repair photolyase